MVMGVVLLGTGAPAGVPLADMLFALVSTALATSIRQQLIEVNLVLKLDSAKMREILGD